MDPVIDQSDELKREIASRYNLINNGIAYLSSLLEGKKYEVIKITNANIKTEFCAMINLACFNEAFSRSIKHVYEIYETDAPLRKTFVLKKNKRLTKEQVIIAQAKRTLITWRHVSDALRDNKIFVLSGSE